MQRKAYIVDESKFKDLVNECKQFDVTWLWSVASRRLGPDEYNMTSNTPLLQFTNTHLSYTQVNTYPMIRGNVAVMMKREVVSKFLEHICADSSKDCPVNMFKEDVTLEEFVWNKGYKTATVYEQKEHPIRYLRGKSTYSV